jgi:hypothetical protein
MSASPTPSPHAATAPIVQKRKRTVSATQARRNTLRNEAYGLLWYCDYCDVFVSSKQRTKKQHLAGHSHAQNMEAYYDKLTRDVKTHAADLRHKEMLGVWTPETIRDDWRLELLQDASTVNRRRLENVVISRRVVIEDQSCAAVSNITSSFHHNSKAADAVRSPLFAGTITGCLSGSDCVGAPPPTSSMMMTPSPRVEIAPGITVGGAVVALRTLSQHHLAAPAVGLPAIRVGHVLVAEGQQQAQQPTQQLLGADWERLTVRFGDLPSPPEAQ